MRLTSLGNPYRKVPIFFVVLIFVIIFSSCAKNLSDPLSPQTTISMCNPDGTYSTSVSLVEVNKMGKELLEEYDVSADQTIRFPFQEYVFQTHGDKAITSLEEAQSKYPNWSIPKKLGKYKFVDFTLYTERTSSVFPDMVPTSKDKIEILTDRDLSQYYLCYQKGDSRFKVSVMPIPEEEFDYEELSSMTSTFTEWSSHPRAYFQPAEENSTSLFRSMWISPELDGKYAFFVCKILGSDCLESQTIAFTEQEADYIYRAIQKEFPN